MSINIGTSFLYKGKYYLDERLNNVSSESDLLNWSVPIPEGFEVYLASTQKWYTYSSSNSIPTTGKFKAREADIKVEVEEDITNIINQTYESITEEYQEYIDNSITILGNDLQVELDGKVDKEPNAGLYPDADREKLASLSEGGNSVVVKGEGDYSTKSVTDTAQGNSAIGDYSHAEGSLTISFGRSSHAEGSRTRSDGHYSHAEGYNTSSNGNNSHAEGNGTSSYGESSHAEGYNTSAEGLYSHAEGTETLASGAVSHAEGDNTVASGYASHAEGENCKATGQRSHAQGYNCIASGDYSFAGGRNSDAIGVVSIAIGDNCTSKGLTSVSMGRNSTADGTGIALGEDCHTNGVYSMAESEPNPTTGDPQYVEIKSPNHQKSSTDYENWNVDFNGGSAVGQSNSAFGVGSFASGEMCLAYERWSFAHGADVVTSQSIQGQVLMGLYPEVRDDVAFAIGRGNGRLLTPGWGDYVDPVRKNLFSVNIDGSATISNSTPKNNNDLTTKGWVDSQITDVEDAVDNLSIQTNEMLANLMLAIDNLKNIEETRKDVLLLGTRTTMTLDDFNLVQYGYWQQITGASHEPINYMWPVNSSVSGIAKSNFIKSVLNGLVGKDPVQVEGSIYTTEFIYLVKKSTRAPQIGFRYNVDFPNTGSISRFDVVDNDNGSQLAFSASNINTETSPLTKIHSGGIISTAPLLSTTNLDPLADGNAQWLVISGITSVDSLSFYGSGDIAAKNTNIDNLALNLKVYVSALPITVVTNNTVDITSASYITDRNVSAPGGVLYPRAEIWYRLPKGTKHFRVVNTGATTVTFMNLSII